MLKVRTVTRCLTTTFFVVISMFAGLIGMVPVQPAHTATVTVASCSLSAVQTAVNNAASGDTIMVPAGNCSWSSNVDISDKLINLIGAGAGATVISSHQVTLTNSGSRISGFTFNLPSGGAGFIIQASVGFRVDHNTITAPSAAAASDNNCFLMYGIGANPIEGLIDHNNMTYCRIIQYGEDSTTAGIYTWSRPLSLGGNHAVFIEDNTLNYPDGSVGGSYLDTTDGNWGCRFVIRFNTFIGGYPHSHGLQGDNERACMLQEYYNNALQNPANPAYHPFFSRGGTLMIFHNTSDGRFLQNEITIDNPRSSEQSIASQVPQWGFCDGTKSVDGNIPGQAGRLCRDQIGAGSDAYFWNGYSGAAPSQTPVASYIWKNIQPAGEIPTELQCPEGTAQMCANQALQIVESRDYYNYRASFNGTSGVGEGPLANRPATCTKGVGYWVTDQGEWNSNNPGADGRLDVCTSTNTWTAGYYMPYTYPHPLQGGAGTNPLSPPTNLRVLP